MGRRACSFCCLAFFGLAIVCALGASEKAEATTPTTTLSPPEGNTTFVGGTTWCVALTTVPAPELQRALDWACGLGSTDCTAVKPGGPCFEPNTLLSHASYAFNSYYQQNGNSDIACFFGGAAIITRRNPSYASCVYLASETASESRPLAPEKGLPSVVLFLWLLKAVLIA
ncbi:hypothetical protein HPP92_018698 [Vanilla planifolia]|uniref:X8 domain-containing protein n=1 Tax=Vanilla planifolia TaxID=51239 RepID=A0A835QE26_VANPL|nr:hypothetical protein HPP92_018698 [Vanilla planifolia]